MIERLDPTEMNPADLTLEELRPVLAPAIADAAVFDGWGDTALEMAALDVGVDVDVARLAFPGGAMDMVDAWIRSIDLAMVLALPAAALAAMPIRERIRAQIQFRLDALLGREEALRRAMAIMALPQNVSRSLKTGWRSADVIWRQAGDTATDYNHYTKRTILAGIYAATLAVFMEDDSADKADTRAFLDRRIAGVMKFEKAKARLLGGDRESFSVMRFLGRLRYPAR
ncbi:COQ9 family protein [Pseudopontixanthobacter vadosimaris]|uniref:COQ9 family protein n=1 Tax=Pseudopontixanthobacter vadosimaris TaxID=2726450 RepID=UPI0014749982|nr:COQ9 family protein [Pseudopontixanthobacter vadosimaris]